MDPIGGTNGSLLASKLKCRRGTRLGRWECANPYCVPNDRDGLWVYSSCCTSRNSPFFGGGQVTRAGSSKRAPPLKRAGKTRLQPFRHPPATSDKLQPPHGCKGGTSRCSLRKPLANVGAQPCTCKSNVRKPCAHTHTRAHARTHADTRTHTTSTCHEQPQQVNDAEETARQAASVR